MAYEFKNLSDVDALEKAGDGTKVLGLDAGNPVQFPVSSVSRATYLIDLNDNQFTQNDTVGGLVSNSETLGDEIIQAIRDGKNIWAQYRYSGDEEDCWANDHFAYITSVQEQKYLVTAPYSMEIPNRFFPTTYTSIFEG